MFCGDIFTSADLQNHKKDHMKKSPKRFHRVNRSSFLSLSNEKFPPKNLGVHPVFPRLSVGYSV